LRCYVGSPLHPTFVTVVATTVSSFALLLSRYVLPLCALRFVCVPRSVMRLRSVVGPFFPDSLVVAFALLRLRSFATHVFGAFVLLRWFAFDFTLRS